MIAYDAPTTAYGNSASTCGARSTGATGAPAGRRRPTVSMRPPRCSNPAVAAASGSFYFQTAGGGNLDKWNVWFRSSNDGGATWSAPVKISDASGGAAYKTRCRLRRGLRGLRGDGDHVGRQGDRRVGRGPELHRSRRRLDQPPNLSPVQLRGSATSTYCSPVNPPSRRSSMKRRRNVFVLILALAGVGLLALMLSGGGAVSSAPSQTPGGRRSRPVTSAVARPRPRKRRRRQPSVSRRGRRPRKRGRCA